MMQISVQSNIDQLSKQLPAMWRKEVPFATAGALDAVARRSRLNVIKAAPAHLDRPIISFLRRNLKYGPGSAAKIKKNKYNMRAWVQFSPMAWREYRFQVNPGIEPARSQYVFIALDDDQLNGGRTTVASKYLKRTAAGNVRKGMIDRAIKHRTTFIADIKGTLGLWERRAPADRKKRPYEAKPATGTGGEHIRLLGVFVRGAMYRKPFPYEPIVVTTVTRHFNREFETSLRKALAFNEKRLNKKRLGPSGK